MIAEYDSTGSLKCGYVYGLERISQRRGDAKHYYVADGQGSIRTLTDTSGTITDTYFYTAFGEELAKTGTTENEFRYVGEQWDPNAGFYYLRARWYDQSTGRFASVDPYDGCIECGLTLHRYLYSASNPISYFDPSGESYTYNSMMTTVSGISIVATRAIIRYTPLLTKVALVAGVAYALHSLGVEDALMDVVGNLESQANEFSAQSRALIYIALAEWLKIQSKLSNNPRWWIFPEKVDTFTLPF